MGFTSLSPIDLQDFEYRFDLTSQNFNNRLIVVETTLNTIIDKINEIISVEYDGFPATAINYSNTLFAWVSQNNVQDVIDFILNKYGNYDLLYDSGSVERDHRQIDHSGLPGIPEIDEDKYNELISGNSTELHRHDTMYYTKTELQAIGVNPATKRLELVKVQSQLEIEADNSYVQQHGLAYKPDFIMVKFYSNNDPPVEIQINPTVIKIGSDIYGIDIRWDTDNLYIKTGTILAQTITDDYTQGKIDIYLYRLV